MALRFTKLTRPNIRALRPGEKITEHGISAEGLTDGDVRYTVSIMVDRRRVHRVIGKQSDGTTRTQCEEFIAQTRSSAKEGRLNLPSGRKVALTFRAAAKLYLEALEETGGKDYVNNEQHLRLHLTPYLGNMTLDQITEFTLEKFRNECGRKGLSESTANRALATYRRMARCLLRWRKIPAPLPMIKLKKEHNVRDDVISDAEEVKIVQAAMADRDPYAWLFVKLGLATGLRHREILSARFDGFDPGRRRLKVKVKGGRWRNQPLTRGINEILKREQKMAEDRDGWIFPSKRSKSGHLEQMSKVFARCVEAAGMDPSIVTPHTMRHTAITRLALTGADIKTIQEFSGHESLEMVLRYAHPQDRAIDRALDNVETRTVIEHPKARKPQIS